MKTIIDHNICLKHNLTPQEVILLLTIREGKYKEDVSNLQAKNIISLQENRYSLNPQWSNIIDQILKESSASSDSEQRLSNLATKMKEIFPKGKMPGTAFFYRCNNREIILKLKKFFLQYGNYSDEDILDATRRFIDSFHGDYKYLPLIKYFISKNKKVQDEDGEMHIQEVSELATYLENQDTDDAFSQDDDWILESKN